MKESEVWGKQQHKFTHTHKTIPLNNNKKIEKNQNHVVCPQGRKARQSSS